MPNLVRVGGVLLREPGGALARGIDCCCIDPPPCANCCIEIGWGAFNGDGDLFEAHSTIVVTLVMPTKNSRVVCDDENVVVVISFVGEPIENAYISWDRHWKWQGNSPSAGPGEFRDGLFEWASLPPDNDGEYKVTLQFDKCWSDNTTQYGDIEAGIRDGDFSLITGTSCDSTACCEPDFPCDDCCWFIEPFHNGPETYEFDADTQGNPVFWAVNVAGDRMKVTVEGTNNGVVCIGAALIIRMNMIPENYTAGEWTPAPYVLGAGGWKHTGHDPAVGVGGVVVDGPPMEVRWGGSVAAREFAVNTSLICPYAPGTITVGFAQGYEGLDTAAIEIRFTCCSDENPDFSCDNCYPEPPVPTYIHCAFFLDSEDGAVDTDVELADYSGGLVVGEWVLIAVWENYTSDGGENPIGATQRKVHYIFRCCDPTGCDSSVSIDAFAVFVDAVHGFEASNTIDCATNELPTTELSVTQIIANTVGELMEPVEDPPQEIYIQEADDGTCPECP